VILRGFFHLAGIADTFTSGVISFCFIYFHKSFFVLKLFDIYHLSEILSKSLLSTIFHGLSLKLTLAILYQLNSIILFHIFSVAFSKSTLFIALVSLFLIISFVGSTVFSTFLGGTIGFGVTVGFVLFFGTTFCTGTTFLIFHFAFIALLSYIFISSFHAHHLVLSSPISLANNCFAVQRGLLIPSSIASTVHNCSTSVCGDRLHSTTADFDISEASFFNSVYCSFNFLNSAHLPLSIALSIQSLNCCTHFTSAS